jgi:hypothetical protein
MSCVLPHPHTLQKKKLIGWGCTGFILSRMQSEIRYEIVWGEIEEEQRLLSFVFLDVLPPILHLRHYFHRCRYLDRLVRKQLPHPCVSEWGTLITSILHWQLMLRFIDACVYYERPRPMWAFIVPLISGFVTFWTEKLHQFEIQYLF